MRKTRVVVTAVLAAAAMVLAACGSTPGQAGDSDSSASESVTESSGDDAASETPPESSDDADDGATEEPGDGAGENPYSAAAGEVGGPACGTPVLGYDDPGAPSGTVTVGYNELSTSLNSESGHGNSLYNINALYLMNGPGLYYYNGDSELMNNVQFGTCTLDSLDPLTVTYTINEGVNWSDGVPVTGADLLLSWISSSGYYNTGTGDDIYDADGNLVETDKVVFDAGSASAELVKDFPTISDDGKSITFVYSDFFVDYELGFGIGVPAHVVATHALGNDDPAAATAELVDLAQRLLGNMDSADAADISAMSAVANFWNTGFDTTTLPSDASLYVSNGPYLLTEWNENQYMSFEPNPDYNWGPKPSAEKIIIAYAPDPTAAVQSLQNGELDIVNPQATADVKDALEALADQGIETVGYNGSAYEHVDLMMNNGGPFDAAAYDGDEATALKVRQAFLLTIPREDIVANLIKPLNPDAAVRNSFMLFPGQPGYDESVAGNGSADYADSGSDAAIERAKTLLADAGVSTPVDVTLLYADGNPRRAQEYQLMAASAAKAGFNLIDGKDAGWAGKLADPGHDAALFAWVSSSTAVSESVENFIGLTPEGADHQGQNNFGGYYNADVNAALNDLLLQTDPAKQKEDQLLVDKQLWADAFGTVLYQFPEIMGYNSNAVTGVLPAPLSPAFLWNFWEWKVVS